jgi:cell division protein FtsB
MAIDMPSKLPDTVKTLVIQQWLKGEQRDKIAGDNDLSAGAVTNIVNEWRQSLGFYLADQLRDFAVTLKKVGITPVQCATGFRIAMSMNRLGIKEDSFESFMSEVYQRCKNLELTPENIASFLTDLLEFSKSVPFSKMTNYMQQKTDEKKKLEQEIKNLEDDVGILQMEKRDCQALRDAALEDMKLTKDELQAYSSHKAELAKYGIPVNDFSKLAKIVDGVKHYEYNVKQLVEVFSDWQLLKIQRSEYRNEVAVLTQQINSLKQERSFLQQTLNSWNQTISNCGELYSMGFHLGKLKLLHDTITEIAVANNIPADEAVAKFFEDIYKQYNPKLGFESQLDKLRAEVNRFNQEEARLRSEMLILPLVGPSLIRLLQKGVREQDIVDIAELLNNSGSSNDRNSKGITIQEIRSLISELRTYGSIELTIKQMSLKVDKLRSQLTSLRTERQNLDAENQTISSTLTYSKQMVSFLSGSAMSLKNEIAGMVTTIAYMMHLLYLEIEQQKQKQKLSYDDDTSTDNEFLPLTLANRGEIVDLPKLKIAVTKAIEIMLTRLNDSNGRLKEVLSKARLSLLNEQLQT